MSAAKLNFTGVDYLRLTATDHEPFPAWDAILLPEYLAEEQAGKKPIYRWMLGYYGRMGEHCFLGKNDTGCMIQLSGGLAWDRWYDAGNHSPRCTRMDLQVTWPVDDDPGLYIRLMYEDGKAFPNANGRPPALQLTDTPTGAKMLTVGSRQSMLYGRMYDKGRESKIPEYDGCVRWEIEVKAEEARDLNAYMREHKSEASTTRAIVKDFWSRRGMTPFWDTYEGMQGKPPVKRTRTIDTKLAWLKTQVAPTLKYLEEEGRLADALRALFGEGMEDLTVDELRRIIENKRGD